MAKKTKIWAFTLLTPIMLIYLFSPPHELTIEITANPIGVQEFYVEVNSSRPNLHGRTVENTYKGLVPINQKAKISLNQNKMLWGGHIGINIYHPEYFRKTTETNNNYILPKAKLSPASWKEILTNSPQWSIDASTSNTGLTREEINIALGSYKLITPNHAIHHTWKFNHDYLNLYLKKNESEKLDKSLEIVDLIYNKYNQALKQNDIAAFLSKKWMKKEMNLMTEAYNEIHEKIN